MALYEGSLNVNKHVFHFLCSPVVLPTLNLFTCTVCFKGTVIKEF